LRRRLPWPLTFLSGPQALSTEPRLTGIDADHQACDTSSHTPPLREIKAQLVSEFKIVYVRRNNASAKLRYENVHLPDEE
jgi:hypothetical protein